VGVSVDRRTAEGSEEEVGLPAAAGFEAGPLVEKVGRQVDVEEGEGVAAEGLEQLLEPVTAEEAERYYRFHRTGYRKLRSRLQRPTGSIRDEHRDLSQKRVWQVGLMTLSGSFWRTGLSS